MKQEIKIRERLGKEKSGQYIDPDDKKRIFNKAKHTIREEKSNKDFY